MDLELPKKLSAYERITAITLALLILFLTTLNFYLDQGSFPEETGDAHFLINPLIEVTIKGAVDHPGVYLVTKGSLVSEAIEMAAPLENANLKRIKLGSKITRRRTITVREK